MMNVLITGATGYLGFRLLTELLNKKYNVIIIKRENSEISNIKLISDKVELYNNDSASIKKAFQENNIDIVIHTATLYGRKGETIFQIKEANLDFPLVLLKHALDNNVKYFINTGTSLSYLTNYYSLFKNQFSECLEFYSSKIVSINILLEHFYGPGDDNSKFITGMINKIRNNISDIELTDGTQQRDFIFINDVIDAYFVIINNINKFIGYNIVPLGSGETVTIKYIIKKIKEQTNSTSNLLFGAIPMRENELMFSSADISILNNLGWYPKIKFTEGLKLILEQLKLIENKV